MHIENVSCRFEATPTEDKGRLFLYMKCEQARH